MMRYWMIVFMVCFLAAAAVDAWAADDENDNRWHLTLEPAGWTMFIDGYTEVAGSKKNVNVGVNSMIDSIDELRMYLCGRTELSKGKFAFLYDGVYVKAADERNKDINDLPFQANANINAKVTVKLGVQEWAGAYQLKTWHLGSQKNNVTLDVLLGARQVYLRAEADTTATLNLPLVGMSFMRSGERSATKSWVNPFIGGRISYPVHDRLVLGLRTDVGGFGAVSEYTWNALLDARYYLTKNKNAFVACGFRGYGDNHSDGDFHYNLVIFGPVVSGGYRF